MKKILYLTAAAVIAALVSCTTDSLPEAPEQATVPVTINVGAPLTKRVGTNSNDMKLKNFQIFVFTNTGKFEVASDLKTTGAQATLNVLPGAKHIWAVANITSALPEPASESAFLATSSSLLNNACDKIAMSGFSEPTITTETQIAVQLKHIACKIVIDSIRRAFVKEDYAGIPLTIRSIYLSNVAGSCDYACSGAMPVY